MKASFSRLIFALIAVLASCGGESRYPAGWPALTDKLRLSLPGHNCPDMRGIYDYDSMQHDNSAFDTRSTFMGLGIDERDGTRWSTITIAGDAATTLTITFQGARSNPDNGSLRPITTRLSVQHGVQYKCDGGWVVGKPQDMFIKSVERQYNRGNERYDTRPKGLQTTQLRRASEGSMVARSDVRETRVLSLWSETGVGIPYWVDVTPYWARWDNFDEQPGTKMSSQVAARIKREEYEKENGVSVPPSVAPAAANVSSAATASAKPTAPVPTEMPAGTPAKPVTGQDLQTLVENIAEGASLQGVTRDGERIILRLHITDPAQIKRTITNLTETSALTDFQHQGTIAGAGKNGIATISMKQR